MSSFYYDLNSKTRVCCCHRHPGCKELPAEDKEEAELIWGLVNYNENINFSEVKTAVKKWLDSENQSGINLIYKINQKRLELEGGTIIHLIYILDNHCIHLLDNLPAALKYMKVAGKSFKIYLQLAPNEVDRFFKVDRPLPIFTALSFVYGGCSGPAVELQERTAVKYNQKIFDFQRRGGYCSKQQSCIGNVSDLAQYFPISELIKTMICHNNVYYLSLNPGFKTAAILHDSIKELTLTKGINSFQTLGQRINQSGLQPKESWYGLLVQWLEVHLEMTIVKFWKAEEKDKMKHFETACKIIIFIYSRDRFKANSTAVCHMSPIFNVFPMMMCPAPYLTAANLEKKHDLVKQIHKCIESALEKVCNIQYQDEQMKSVRSTLNLVIGHNGLCEAYFWLTSYLKATSIKGELFYFMVDSNTLHVKHISSVYSNVPPPLGDYFKLLLRGSLGQKKQLIKVQKRFYQLWEALKNVTNVDGAMDIADGLDTSELNQKGIDLYRQLLGESYLMSLTPTSGTSADCLMTRLEQETPRLHKCFTGYKEGKPLSNDMQRMFYIMRESMLQFHSDQDTIPRQVKIVLTPKDPAEAKVAKAAKEVKEAKEAKAAKAAMEAEKKKAGDYDDDDDWKLDPEVIKELREMAIQDMLG